MKIQWKELFSLERVICRLLAAWSTYIGVTLLSCENYAKLAEGPQFKPLSLLGWMLAFFVIYSAMSALLIKLHADSWWMLLGASLCAYQWIVCYSGGDDKKRFLVTLGVLLAYSLFALYTVHKNGEWLAKWNPNGSTVALFAACFAILACVILSIITCLRYKTFSTPNYDFGLFCNMFSNMRKTGLPLITSERDQLLSHFAVHISPIFYLLLPFYAIFPSPMTLQIGQAVFLTAGVIPMVLLARHYKLSGKLTILFSFLYCFYPVLSTGCFYDLHENCFLPFFLLFTFYFFEKGKYLPMYISALFVLAVKEDAAIFLIVFAAYVILSRKKYLHGGILAAVAVGYFLLATHLINTYGDGVLSNRFDNLLVDPEDGIVGVAITAISNPGYLLTQLFTTGGGDWNKIYYFLVMFLPLGMLPFCTKKPSRWLLLGAILLNVLSYYQYLYDPGFQYHFGALAFLMYAALQNVADLKAPTKRTLCSIAAVACCGLYLCMVVPKLEYYTDRWQEDKETFVQMEEILDTLPEDASLSVSTMLLAHVADYDEVYEVGYHKDEKGRYKTDVDFVVLDARYAHGEEKAAYLAAGYTVYREEKGLILILQKGNEATP